MTIRRGTCGRARQTGAGMVETMVGILIGLLVVVVIYNLLAVAEGYKRTVTGMSDAQITGLLSQFVAGRDAGNGGYEISVRAPVLVNCTKNEAGAADVTLKPVPVLITDGGAAGVSDSFVSTHSGSPHVLWPISFTALANPGQDFVVQSPNGFTAPDGVTSLPTAADPYWSIVMANDGTGRCKLIKVTNATPPDAQGRVTLSHDAVTIPYIATAKLVILGRDGFGGQIRYDVVNGQLRTTDLRNAAAPNPIAQNVVLMKVQYGVDTTNVPDNVIDCWTSAVDNGCGGLYQDIRNLATIEELQRILAVRIGIVVRSDEPGLVNGVVEPTLKLAARPPVVLFDCSAKADPPCIGRIVLPMGVPATVATPTCAPNIICEGWRYRTYETIVPLRNAIFNSTLP